MAKLNLTALNIALCLLAHGCNTTPEQGAATRAKNRQAPPCKLDLKQLGPMRHPGRAHVRFTSKDGIIEAKNAPAACGPFYNQAAPSLGIKAGEGLMFETCLPEGLIQLTSLSRTAGLQNQNQAADAVVTDLTFNRNAGATFAMRRAPTDRIVVSDDFLKAEGRVELRDETNTISLKGTITFDCTKP